MTVLKQITNREVSEIDRHKLNSRCDPKLAVYVKSICHSL